MFNNIDTKSVTFNLIAVNVLLFFATMMFPQLNIILSLHYIFNTRHFDFSAYSSFFDTFGFQPYQILTHMFMHGGVAHILFNMLGLFMFGSVLENVWGPKRFLIFYLITGFGAVALHMSVQAFVVHQATGYFAPDFQVLQMHPDAIGIYGGRTVGASGAIFGIATAFAMLFPNTEMILLFFPIPIKAKYLMPLYILAELFFGISGYKGDDVAHFAHLGGALFGFILVKIWGRNRNSLY